ncbi:fungal zn(2)-Cys(6) binuclear cluster domain-containing protein [Pochonia chlamydosporia 170]|uniref:Fungal zn(2)-Cys(6) binuclear cluster domain-containing protein n=1 Tax=Pochonia chlamydosporia 170 TaxID=1380566 RepID=A0A179FRU3_METCM|nr:fungal zn(2)-Cys(6) binuclear cluster domain-containing protein [Pochonia chlamydosporia 170]OAQ67803.1 fungal zn(2)-Cys(6) binuclear cluster domain-containing protein [Pochonia chlamydosporia 170]
MVQDVLDLLNQPLLDELTTTNDQFNHITLRNDPERQYQSPESESDLPRYADSVNSICSQRQGNCHLDADNFNRNIPAGTGVGKDAAAPESYVRGVLRTGPLRRQNHACDTCRSSKRACDLPVDGTVLQKHETRQSCTTCRIRGVPCTTIWLSKKRSQRAKKWAQNAARNSGVNGRKAVESVAVANDCPVPKFGTKQNELATTVLAGALCEELCHVYISVWDIPISQCLLQGSLPPQYSRGISAYGPLCRELRESDRIPQGKSWILTHWPLEDSNTASPMKMVTDSRPHLFNTAYVLDVFFSESGHSSLPPNLRLTRDKTIDDAYKWAAVATAAQFVVGESEKTNDRSERSRKKALLSQSRDVAACAWHKARDAAFRSIAATTSFRHAIALVIFGMIPTSGNSAHDGRLYEQDSVYALREGLQRLCNLCKRARLRLAATDTTNRAQDSPRDERSSSSHELFPGVTENLIELLGAVEWMVSMLNSLAIVTSKGSNCPLPIDRQHTETPWEDSTWLNTTPISWPYDPEIDHSIVTRAEVQSTTVAMYQDLGFDEAMLQAGRQTTCLAFLLWKHVAQFVLATKEIGDSTRSCNFDTLCRHYKTIASLIALWSRSFGSVPPGTSLDLKQTKCGRMFAFHANTGNFAILLFYEVARELEDRLSALPPNRAGDGLTNALRYARTRLKSQRLMSATMTSIIISGCTSGSDLEVGSSTPQLKGVPHIPYVSHSTLRV